MSHSGTSHGGGHASMPLGVAVAILVFLVITWVIAKLRGNA